MSLCDECVCHKQDRGLCTSGFTKEAPSGETPQAVQVEKGWEIGEGSRKVKLLQLKNIT